ncbi:helix-turn-helix domain-containing protein [Shimwellia pseudoproteus]|uniref:helix-turn-helix transcriptional regulator n=1 Tax=Shimwellia pseudoproteus TaxID=570012 RepID=UPI0018ED10E9|nr:helix-turn-helix transcriptional regulator [Shimwellia pseudoproteus]MBJ3815443.1 helix-turn-helix domain-containing protein [Shimwellia pseudoproteus]
MMTTGNPLGDFLRHRRMKLDPVSFGFTTGRRRTPGLRREEVAQLANISPTWYTWLEQGRGGAPSREVLSRIASGLMLTEPEREHLFLLAFGHPPERHYRGTGTITPRLQGVLDALPYSPAIIKTALWDVIAWNRAATVILADYEQLAPRQRNVLRLLFTDPQARTVQEDWQRIAQFVVNAFRADVARMGGSSDAMALVDELSLASEEFAAFWQNNDVTHHSEGVKRLRHPALGLIELAFSTFSLDGRPDLQLLIFNPATPESQLAIQHYLAETQSPS